MGQKNCLFVFLPKSEGLFAAKKKKLLCGVQYLKREKRFDEKRRGKQEKLLKKEKSAGLDLARISR